MERRDQITGARQVIKTAARKTPIKIGGHVSLTLKEANSRAEMVGELDGLLS